MLNVLLFYLKQILRKVIPVPNFLVRRTIKKYLKKYPAVLSLDDTVQLILKGYSIVRFGDGELNLIFGKGIYFQKFDVNLSLRLKKIIRLGINHENNFAVCIQRMKYGGKFWRNYWFWNGGEVCKLLNNKLQYGDLGVSRHIDLEGFNKLIDYWKGKKVLVITGQNSKLMKEIKLVENLNFKFLLFASTNAFDEYSEILDKTKKHIRENNTNLVLVSLGPTSNLLCYDLSMQMKIQSLDIGHLLNTVSYKKFGTVLYDRL